MLAMTGCGATDTGGRGAAIATLEEFLAGGTQLVLEEDDDVINVWPMVRPDPRGGFLLADMKDHAIRRYSDNGHLHFTAGRHGDGPEEFQQPTAALRLGTGEIVAIDMRGRAVVFDSAGQTVIQTHTLPIRLIEDATILNDSTVVVAGVIGGGGVELTSPRLHLWDFRRDTIVASLFTPQIGSEIQTAASMARWANLATRGDTIAATFVLQDTIFIFLPDGTQVGRIPMPAEHFRMATPMPDAARTDMQARTTWVRSFHMISRLEWLSDGGFLVQYQGFGEKMQPYFNLLRLTRAGERVFEFRDAPRFLTVAGDFAYFLDPDQETPNHWVVARLH
jgi:hypothetical protein